MLKLIDEHDEWKERADVFSEALKAAYNERDILRSDIERKDAALKSAEVELAQARKWSSAWKEWAKWAFHYCRHNSACASFAEEEAA